VTTGFGHAAVLGVAPAVIDAVKAGQISRFVLIGGCDGAESERSYYSRLATSLPDSAVILTLGCGKFRVIGKKDYGNVPGTSIPRVLDSE
jgi:hydroxylamine reductase